MLDLARYRLQAMTAAVQAALPASSCPGCAAGHRSDGLCRAAAPAPTVAAPDLVSVLTPSSGTIARYPGVTSAPRRDLAARSAGQRSNNRQAAVTRRSTVTPLTVMAPAVERAPAAVAVGAPVASSVSLDTKAHLAEIFRRISVTEQSAAGLRDLHAFMQTHPGTDIEPFLARTSSQFRAYIQRGLARAAAGTLDDAAQPAVSTTLADTASARLQALTAKYGAAAAVVTDKENALPRTLPVENAAPATAGSGAPSLDELRMRFKALGSGGAVAPHPAPVIVPAAPVSAPNEISQSVTDLRVRDHLVRFCV